MHDINTYILPSYWASYLINNDPSGLSDEEKLQVDEWLKANSYPSFIDCGDKEYFSWGNDANSLGGNVMEFRTIAKP